MDDVDNHSRASGWYVVAGLPEGSILHRAAVCVQATLDAVNVSMWCELGFRESE